MHYLLLEGEITTMAALFTEIGTSVTTVLGKQTSDKTSNTANAEKHKAHSKQRRINDC